MRLALNQATLMNTPMVEFLEASASAGFQGVELRHPQLLAFVEKHPAAELGRRLEDLGLECITINALELFSLCSEEQFASMLELCQRLMETGSRIGCRTIVAVPSFLTEPLSDGRIVKRTRERLHRIARIASHHQFRVAFEPLGFPDCSVRRLELARTILAGEELPEMGLVIDTFHFFVGGHSLDDLRAIDGKSIWLIHLDDAAGKPVESLKDSDRVYPLQGSFPLPGFFEALAGTGYDGWVSLELFNEQLWTEPAVRVANQAMSSMQALL